MFLGFLLILICRLVGTAYAGFPAGNTNLSNTLDTWSFNDTVTWTNDHGFGPISFTNLDSSILGNGTCLVLDSTNAAWLQYNITEASGTNNLALNQGTILLWFAPSWTDTKNGGTGPGKFGRLVDVGSYTTNASYGWWSFYLDPAGTNVYFAAQTNNGSQAVFLSAPVSFDLTNFWHMFALTYCSTGCAFYFDGFEVTNGTAVTIWPGPNVLTNGLFIGSDNSGVQQAHGMFDDISTYNYCLAPQTITTAFIFSSFLYYENPYNRANRMVSAPWVPTNTITGPGYLRPLGSVTGCVSSTNVWLTNVVVTMTNNGTLDVTFSVMGGSSGANYDVFATAALDYPITNAYWAWMGQVQSCTRYVMTNLPPYAAYIILGTPLDSDSDGLTDAFENLVSHTDPHNPDTYGVGMSDGFQWGYFGQGGLDPYTLCSSGDGWTYLQAYQNGYNPRLFYTPPAPTGLTAYYQNGVATVTWDPSPGPVLRYVIERDIPPWSTDFYTNLASVTSYEDDPFPAPEPDLEYDAPMYAVTAIYPGGYSGTSRVRLYGSSDSSSFRRYGYNYGSAAFVRGPGGNLYLVWSGALTNVPTVNLVRQNYDWTLGSTVFTNWALPTSSFTNGIYAVPQNSLPPIGSLREEEWSIQTTNSVGLNTVAQIYFGNVSQVPFIDGREQMKENLAFVFREATPYSPFLLEWTSGSGLGNWSDDYSFPSSYAYSGFYDMGLASSSPAPPFGPYEYGPFMYNAMYRNFVNGGTNDLYPWGALNTGADWVPSYVGVLNYPSTYQFVPPTNSTPVPPLLSSATSRWLDSAAGDPTAFGVTVGGYNNTMSGTASNGFGLQYLSVQFAWGNGPNQSQILYAGGSVSNYGGWCYAEPAQPVLQTVDYYFTQVQPNHPTLLPLSPLPGQDNFSVTNTTPFLMTSVGDSTFRVAGYAKQRLLNGYPNTFGYLGQYFDKAYMANTNGTPSTNQTGLLSEYGDFLATEPGTVILKTKPDLSQTNNLQGECVVQVIKLQLDVNHDGFMDLTFGGPDNTSPEHPFVFWVNDNYDRWHAVGPDQEEDDLASNDPEADCPHAYRQPTPDSEYRNSLNERVIPCLRDLEDFARLWICAGASNLVASLPPGVTGQLSWGDVGSPNTNNPTIDLFDSADVYGGNGYLTNFTDATHQTNTLRGTWVERLRPGDSFTIVGNGLAWPRLIWCGVKKGTGALTLTMTQGTNIIGSASAYIQIKDIKELYERHTVGDEPNVNVVPSTSARLAQDGLLEPFHYPPPTDTSTPYIVLVHDYDLPTWKKDRYAETAFKRLYWQGYQGRLGLFRWPSVNTGSHPLENSEFNAWRSAAGLQNLLTNLNAQYPGNVYLIAHGHGAIVAGEALRLAGTNQVVNRYIVMQGALASEAYDPTMPPRRPAPWATPDRYLLYYTNAGSIWPYFWGVGGAGAYINYFNTNDYVLTNLWCSTQDAKPDFLYHWDGTNFLYSYYPSLLLLFPADRYQIFSYADQARSDAIGAQPNLGGPFQSLFQVDLAAYPYGFGGKSKDHTAQFLSDYTDRWTFWDQVLRSMGLKP